MWMTGQTPRAVWLLAFSAALGACGEEAEPLSLRDAGSPRGRDSGIPVGASLLEVVAALELQGLAAAISAAELETTLSGPGPFTLLAPTEAAFSAITPPSDPSLLANVLLNHVLPYRATEADILASQTLRTSANLTVLVDPAAAPPTVGGAGLSILDREARNGIVHVIDAVLIPPDIPSFVQTRPELSTLQTALEAASTAVRDELAGASITLFAPRNTAFAGMSIEGLLADTAILDEVLRYHIASGQRTKADLRAGDTVTMANGQTLVVEVQPGGQLMLVDSESRLSGVVIEDIRLANGVVHVIDRALSPAQPNANLVETLQRSNLNNLVQAVRASGLTDTLTNGGPFTVFAPTDGALSAAQLPTRPELVANVLVTHLVEGRLTTEALSRQPFVRTVGGSTVSVDFRAAPPTVGDRELTPPADRPAVNGIVHAIDGVILPPNIADGLDRIPEASTLRSAMDASDGLRDRLEGSEPITLFVPVNSAFDMGELQSLLGTPNRLANLLANHLAEGQYLSTELPRSLTMANGSMIRISREGGAVSLLDSTGSSSRVLSADLRLLNGVVHLVERLIRPGHLVEQAWAAGLDTLAGLVDRAELTTTLTGDGPFTLLAPTNAAFEALASNLGVGLEAIPRGVLVNVLLNHVVPASLSSAELVATSSVTNVAGLPLVVTSTGGGTVRVGGARLGTRLDVEATNGVLHILDEVIVPPTTAELAAERPDLSTLATALSRASGAVQTAASPAATAPPITLFMPTNDAFLAQGLDPGALTSAELDPILRHHVVAAQLTSEVFNGSSVGTLNGNIRVTPTPAGGLTVTDGQGNTARVLETDVRALNGVVYVIDRVLTPISR